MPSAGLQSPLLRCLACALGVAAVIALGAGLARALPITTREGVLPPGTELNEEPLDQPTELFSSELAGGKRPYPSVLGDMLFSSPAILGGVARQAGISCNTCHQQGHNNPKLFVPGLSSRPGTFDTTGALFNPKADNHVFDPVTPPSLRGAKHLAPYGHDGRFATLRDFIHNVIVNEFAGAEPSVQVLDALVAYVEDIAFLPNARLGADGHLASDAPAAARRGERLFFKPFPRDSAMSCATCHNPASDFVDHQVHNVGTGGRYKTETLINANFNAPYFHDGRYDTYEEVVDYFDRHFDLGLSAKEQADLVAYLEAVGGGNDPVTRDTVQTELDELTLFSGVLDTAIPARNQDIIALTVTTVGDQWRELGENFPPRADTSVNGGLDRRLRARGAVRGVVLALRRVEMAAADGDFADATQAYADYRQQAAAAAADLKAAEPWSLFNSQIREAHFAALRQLAELAK